MRYAADQKERSRDRILSSASRTLRSKGVEVVRVADVMSAAGMTNGGFYKHFESKEHLVREAMESALKEVAEQLAHRTNGLPREKALKSVIEYYLSEQHLDHPDRGCALAALGTEVARLPQSARLAIGQALDDYSERLRHLMPGASDEERRTEFLVLFSSMAGCVMAARTYVDKKHRRRILEGARAFFIHAFCETPAQARFHQ